MIMSAKKTFVFMDKILEEGGKFEKSGVFGDFNTEKGQKNKTKCQKL